MDSDRQPALENRKHIPALDGLRGLAVLLVMWFHFVLWQHQNAACTLDRVYAYLCETAWIGVDFFFVLSGFLITGILLDAKRGRHYFRNFYARRTLRIFPLYYLFLIVMFWVFPALAASPDEFRQASAAPWSYWLYVSNFTQLHESHYNHALIVTWSLAIEEQFYLLWPTVVWFCSPRGTLLAATAVLLLSIGCRIGVAVFQIDPRVDYYWTCTHMDGLAIGALLSVLLQTSRPKRQLLLDSGLAAIAGVSGTVLAMGLAIHRHVSMHADPIGQIWLCTSVALLGAALLIAGVERSNAIARLLASPIPRFFGKYSYGMYLLQGIVQAWVTQLIHFNLPRLGASRMPSAMAFFVANLAGTTLLAWLSYNFMERYFLRLKRYFPETQHEAIGTL